MNKLQDLVLSRLSELGTPGSPMSVRQAALRSKGLLTYETIRSIARGEHSGRISDKTAEGLATALQVPVQQIYQVAHLPRPMNRWQLPQRLDRLNAAQRQMIEAVAGGLIDAWEKGFREGRDSALQKSRV